MDQAHALNGEGSQTIGSSADRCSQSGDTRPCVHGRLNLYSVGADSHIRKNEVEGVGTSGLENQISRQVEGASSAAESNRDDAVADILSQSLDASVQGHPVVTIYVRVASQDISSAGGYWPADCDGAS